MALILLVMVTMTMAMDLRELLSRRYNDEWNDEVSTTKSFSQYYNKKSVEL